MGWIRKRISHYLLLVFQCFFKPFMAINVKNAPDLVKQFKFVGASASVLLGLSFFCNRSLNYILCRTTPIQNNHVYQLIFKHALNADNVVWL